MDGFPDFGRLLYESRFTMSVTSHARRLVFVIAVSLGVSSQLFGSQAELIGHWDGTMVREGVRLEGRPQYAAYGSIRWVGGGSTASPIQPERKEQKRKKKDRCDMRPCHPQLHSRMLGKQDNETTVSANLTPAFSIF
jgi:hypothetical protein